MRFLFIVYLVVEALSFLLLTTQVTIHPVVTATSSAASTAMNAPSITGLLFWSSTAADFMVSVTTLLLHAALPVTVLVVKVPTVVDISLVCVDCRQLVGVTFKYSVMTVVVVEHDGAGHSTVQKNCQTNSYWHSIII